MLVWVHNDVIIGMLIVVILTAQIGASVGMSCVKQSLSNKRTMVMSCDRKRLFVHYIRSLYNDIYHDIFVKIDEKQVQRARVRAILYKTSGFIYYAALCH